MDDATRRAASGKADAQNNEPAESLIELLERAAMRADWRARDGDPRHVLIARTLAAALIAESLEHVQDIRRKQLEQSAVRFVRAHGAEATAQTDRLREAAFGRLQALVPPDEPVEFLVDYERRAITTRDGNTVLDIAELSYSAAIGFLVPPEPPKVSAVMETIRDKIEPLRAELAAGGVDDSRRVAIAAALIAAVEQHAPTLGLDVTGEVHCGLRMDGKRMAPSWLVDELEGLAPRDHRCSPHLPLCLALQACGVRRQPTANNWAERAYKS